MSERKNSANSILKIVTAIAIIITFCVALWAYKLNANCDQMKDEIVNLKSEIIILDVQLEYCENSIEQPSIGDKYSDLTAKERLSKAREELDKSIKELDKFLGETDTREELKALKEYYKEAHEGIIPKNNTKPWFFVNPCKCTRSKRRHKWNLRIIYETREFL